jgi:hypothetical protein
MRVGVDARLMHFQPAGISRYTWHLLQALAELDKDDEFIIFQHRDQRTPLFTRRTFSAPRCLRPRTIAWSSRCWPWTLSAFPARLAAQHRLHPAAASSADQIGDHGA